MDNFLYIAIVVAIIVVTIASLIFVSKKSRKREEYMKSQAEAGNPDAQLVLGYISYFEYNKIKDAMHWLALAQQQGGNTGEKASYIKFMITEVYKEEQLIDKKGSLKKWKFGYPDKRRFSWDDMSDNFWHSLWFYPIACIGMLFIKKDELDLEYWAEASRTESGLIAGGFLYLLFELYFLIGVLTK